jgi:hypothetical protein
MAGTFQEQKEGAGHRLGISDLETSDLETRKLGNQRPGSKAPVN